MWNVFLYGYDLRVSEDLCDPVFFTSSWRRDPLTTGKCFNDDI